MGSGGFHVMSRKCDQCLLSPERIVSATRAAQIIKECALKDCSFLCHKGTIAGREIACRGHFDTGVGQMSRIAERFRMIVEIDPDTLEPANSNHLRAGLAERG